MRGLFITLEGGDGAGKSTQIDNITRFFEKKGLVVLHTREPGGTSISEKIRGIILDKDNTEMSPECEALLYASSRAQLLQQVILPSLNQGKLVICDRYYDSSFAYQAFARGLGLDFVKSINAFALTYGVPDLTLFLDLPPVDAFKRKGGADMDDRIEAIGLEFHNKVYNGYKQMQSLEPNRIISVDCSKEKEQTHKNIINVLKEKGILW